jgi:hypothetical protein
VKHRAAKLSSLALVYILLTVLITPSANSVPEGVTYTGDTRTVPIFAVSQEGGQQPTQVASTGFLYSSRIVFTAGVREKIFDQTKGGIYVGKPGSKTTDKSGRVKVIKAFYPNSGNAELDDFVVFVLEKDLASVEPFPLLQMGQESSAREASVRGYGEYLNRCGPGAQGPCPEKPTSEVPRQINVNVISLSQAESLVGYERTQLSGQIILQNARNAQDGVVCRGDAGSPVIGNFGGTSIYLGAAGRAMNAKVCGAVGVEKVERDKPKVNSSFDGIAGITHIAPVYRFSSVIDEARNYAAQTAEAALDKSADPLTGEKENICGASRTQMPGFTVQREGTNVLYAWSKEEEDKQFLVLSGELYLRNQGEKLPKDFGGKRVCSFLNDSGKKVAVSLLYDSSNDKKYSAAGKLIFQGKKSIGDKNQWVFIFSLKKDGGTTWDFRPVVDRDGTLGGRWLKLRCSTSYFMLPVLQGAEFTLGLIPGTKAAKVVLKSSTLGKRFLFGQVQIAVAAATVVAQGTERKTSYEMADATVTIVSDNINQLNQGDTLEVFIPSLNKTTTGIVRAIKVGASKGSTVIKWGFGAEQFTQFAINVSNLESNKRESEKICPSLN